MSCSERLALKKGDSYREKVRSKKWVGDNSFISNILVSFLKNWIEMNALILLESDLSFT